MNPSYSQVAKRALHRCEYCRAPEAAFNTPFEVDHVLPISSGRDDSIENLALCCRSCNGFKSSRTKWEDPVSGNIEPLFNPRVDHWDVHFEIDQQTLRINGKTPIARATVELLRINSQAQLLARFQWERLDLFA